MKKTLIMFTVLAVSGLLLTPSSFATNTPRTKACKAHVPGDPCSYTRKGKTVDGTCVSGNTNRDNLICVKN